jgi:hypothetical protein
VESCCELGNEPSGSIKCWELPSGCTSCGLSSGTQLHRVSYLIRRTNSTGCRIESQANGDNVYSVRLDVDKWQSLSRYSSLAD